jgi:hypothetical protein
MTTLAAVNPTLLFLAGCAVLVWVLLRRCYRRCGRKAGQGNRDYLEHLHRPTSAWDGACHDADAIIEREKVELYDMARDAAGRLDSKLILLDQMMATNERQIERMERLLAELEAASPATCQVAAGVDCS